MRLWLRVNESTPWSPAFTQASVADGRICLEEMRRRCVAGVQLGAAVAVGPGCTGCRKRLRCTLRGSRRRYPRIGGLMEQWETALDNLKHAYRAWHETKGASIQAWLDFLADEID